MSEETTLMTDQAPTDAVQQTAPVDAAEAPVVQDTAPAVEAKPAETVKTEPEDFEITLPDGETLDEAAIAEIKAQAKELGLDKEKADKLAASRVAQQKAFIESQQAMFEKSKTEWADRSKADPEIGGDKFQENLGLAKKALDTFGSDELKTLIATSGFGNHPEVIRLFNRIGKAISEDRLVTGKGPSAPEDPAKRLFPNQQ